MSSNHFEAYGLSADILTALAQLGYEQPTPVQREVIPQVLAKRDLVVKSQTGSGKTASYGIPLCELVEWNENKPQALILTPTRELAAQVREDLTNIGRFKRIKATAVFGKDSFLKQKAELKQKSHVVVGTPGRVLDHIGKGTLPVERIAYLVIDEADEMLSMGFIDQVGAIIELLPQERVTLLFSATLPQDVKDLCQRYMRSPMDIEIAAEGITTDRIEHSLYEVREADKLALLRDVTRVHNPDSCIIFCRTQERVNEVFEQLAEWDYPCEKIHGGMLQTDRFAVMNEFRRGEFRYLVATDVAARGIDIDNITHVINYDLPLEKESYVHRTGRTGRAGNTGTAVSFAAPGEERFVTEIEAYLGFVLSRRTPPTEAEAARNQEAFEAKIHAQPELKRDKSEALNRGIMKLYFGGGKKKKLRAVDFVGTLSRIEGMRAEDIGIITIQDQMTYVEILNGKGPMVLNAMKHTTVKGKLLKVHKARD